jgi:sulfate transport system permease protein
MTRRPVLPGLRPALGFGVVYVCLLVLLPLSTLVVRSAGLGPSGIWRVVSTPRAVAALRLSFGASFVAAGVDVLFGLLVAWVLARYRFFGRRVLDAIVDLPFALPTAVAGIALTTLWAPAGPFGRALGVFGIQGAYSPLGIVIALSFVGLPFVVRTVQPVLADLDPETEEAAQTLGASDAQTFLRVILPATLPALATGFTLAFARAVGEYGSVVFISGNMPMRTEIAPLLVMTKLEQFDYAGATAIGLVMLVVSFALLFLLQRLQARLVARPA